MYSGSLKIDCISTHHQRINNDSRSRVQSLYTICESTTISRSMVYFAESFQHYSWIYNDSRSRVLSTYTTCSDPMFHGLTHAQKYPKPPFFWGALFFSFLVCFYLLMVLSPPAKISILKLIWLCPIIHASTRDVPILQIFQDSAAYAGLWKFLKFHPLNKE